MDSADKAEKLDKRVIDRMMVKISHLDTLLSLVGEVIITSNNIHTTNRRVQDFYDRQVPLNKQTMDMLKSSEVASNRTSSDLHSLVMDIRMVEIRATFQRFRRSVRDTAKESGKQVELVTLGEETLVDKTIAEKLYDPLNHQIRNAIDHGLEDPLERQKQGKSTTGTLTLRAYQRENNIFIEIKDDGRGIDPDAVARAAMDRGVLEPADAEKLSVDDKLHLIFHPGLSTKSTASKISGRGVGMDVVKSNIEELGGEVIIDTKIGEGTSFTYRIPQVTAVNILDCLTVRAGNNYFAAPILNVVSTLRMISDKVQTTLQKGRSIMHLGSLVPLFDLNRLLGNKSLETSDEITIVIVEAKNGRIALEVSELMTPEKLVFSPLSSMFRVQGISGTTMIGANKMGMVLDIVELINRSHGIPLREEEEPVHETKQVAEIVRKAETEIMPSAALEEGEEAGGEAKGLGGGQIVLSSDIGREISHKEEFFSELEDMIKDADEQILSLENNPADMELINRIFRDFHSMKGNLMMVGLAELGGFIHEVEAILDQARSGTLPVTPEIIDILLDASDVIKAGKMAITEGKAPSIDKNLLLTIRKYRQIKEEQKAKPVDVHERTFHLGSLERINLMAHKATDNYVYQVLLTIRPKYQHPFLVALLILKRIARLGHVFSTVPTVEEIENQNLENQLKVMFTSEKDENVVREFIRETLMKYYDVEEFEMLKAK